MAIHLLKEEESTPARIGSVRPIDHGMVTHIYVGGEGRRQLTDLRMSPNIMTALSTLHALNARAPSACFREILGSQQPFQSFTMG